MRFDRKMTIEFRGYSLKPTITVINKRIVCEREKKKGRGNIEDECTDTSAILTKDAILARLDSPLAREPRFDQRKISVGG